MPKAKKAPVRMCSGCGEHREKRELIRIVKTPQGSIEVDVTGRKNGRGAYICPKVECLDKAVRAKRLERAFSSPVSEEVFKLLSEEIAKYEG